MPQTGACFSTLTPSLFHVTANLRNTLHYMFVKERVGLILAVPDGFEAKDMNSIKKNGTEMPGEKGAREHFSRAEGVSQTSPLHSILIQIHAALADVLDIDSWTLSLIRSLHLNS